jgi:hypothetical protein
MPEDVKTALREVIKAVFHPQQSAKDKFIEILGYKIIGEVFNHLDKETREMVSDKSWGKGGAKAQKQREDIGDGIAEATAKACIYLCEKRPAPASIPYFVTNCAQSIARVRKPLAKKTLAKIIAKSVQQARNPAQALKAKKRS